MAALFRGPSVWAREAFQPALCLAGATLPPRNEDTEGKKHYRLCRPGGGRRVREASLEPLPSERRRTTDLSGLRLAEPLDKMARRNIVPFPDTAAANTANP